MRNAPPLGLKKLSIAKTTAKLTLDSPEWQNATAHALTLLPPLHTLPRATTIRLLYDDKALHLRAEAELGDVTTFTAFNRDRVLTNQEAFDVYLAPNPAQPLSPKARTPPPNTTPSTAASPTSWTPATAKTTPPGTATGPAKPASMLKPNAGTRIL